MALPLKGIHRPVGEITVTPELTMSGDDIASHCFETQAALYSSHSDKPLPVSPTHPSTSPLLNVGISPVTTIERGLGGGAPPGWGKQDKRTKGSSEGWIQRTAGTRWLDGIIGSLDVNLPKLQETVKDGKAWHAAAMGSQRAGPGRAAA